MKLTVLGEYGPYAKCGNATSSYLLEEGNTKILLDAGSGSLSRLYNYLNPNDLTAIILTHLHFDHIADIGLYAYAIKNVKIPLYYPNFYDSVVKSIDRMRCFDVIKTEDFDTFNIGDLNVTFVPSVHPVKCLGVFMENEDGKSLYYAGDSRFNDDMSTYVKKADLFLCNCPYISAYTDRTPHISYDKCLELSKEIQGKTVISHHNPEVSENVVLEKIKGYDVELAKEGKIFII